MTAHPPEQPHGQFTPEESRIHDLGIQRIREGLASGLGYDDACSRIEAADAELRRVIADDFLKVTIAEQHFQGGRGIDDLASALKLPPERVARAREEMIAEVARASVEVFRRQSGGAPDA